MTGRTSSRALPVGFHFMVLLKSCVSCSSAHGSGCTSPSGDWTAPWSRGDRGCVSASGVEAALALALLRGAIRTLGDAAVNTATGRREEGV